MNHVLLMLTWLTPLLMVSLANSRFARAAVVIGTLPGLVAAILVPVGTGIDVPWLLLGSALHLDETGSLYLFFSSLMWLFAGTYAVLTLQQGLTRFATFFLLACAGNLLLIVAADMVTFYVGFALMGLAATGLIMHRRSQLARRAARVYLMWTLVGEMAIFTAVVLLAGDMPSLRFSDLMAEAIPDTAVALLLLGFGIKLAVPGLHVWLPLSYAAAPASAAAVLSGPMISAGLLGWLRFLPPGGADTASWGEGLITIGVVGVCLGTLLGLLQHSPRTVLAYSSIAKMGLLTAVFGTALGNTDAAPAIIAALVVFTMHHLMLKGTLFLGIGEWQRGGRRPWLTFTTLALALAMIGTPFTSGSGAKLMLDEATTSIASDMGLLLGFSSLGTLLLMARLLWLLTQRRPAEKATWDSASLVWATLAALALVLPLALLPMPVSGTGFGILAVGLAIAVIAAGSRGQITFRLPRVPSGDLLYFARIARQLWRRRINLGDVTLSPRVLVSPGDYPLPARNWGTLTWLMLGVVILVMILLPG